MVLHYKFDESSGTRVNDYSGNKNHGTIEDADWTNAGKIDGGLKLDGTGGAQTNGYVLNAAVHDLTASIWFKSGARNSHNRTGFERLIVQSQKPYGGVLWMTMTNWKREYKLANRYAYLLRGNTELKSGVWNHAVITWEDDVRKLYVNGKLDAVMEDSLAEASNSFLHIGRNTFLHDAPFIGTLDDVQIYDRALSATEVKQLYNNPGETVD